MPGDVEFPSHISGPQGLQPEAAKTTELKKVDFSYKESVKPPSSSTSLLGPAVRLFATFITLGVSEDVHRAIKKTLIATLSKFLTDSFSKEDRQKMVDKFKADGHYKTATKLSVNIGQKAVLDGMLIKPEEESEKYVILLNGLGECYEGKLALAGEYADKAQANVLVFNYRGVGDSSSTGPTQPKDLVEDALAMIAFLTEKGVKPEDIVLHGFSLGGGVGTAAAQATGTRLINDRSFSTFSKATKEMVTFILKEKVGESAARAIGTLTGALVRGYDLDLNPGKVYRSGLKDTLILYHPDDPKINKSSLKKNLDKHEITAENKASHRFVLLNSTGIQTEDIHDTFVTEFEETAKHIAEFIHNKPFDLIAFSNADLEIDFGDLEPDEGVLNFIPKSESILDFGELDSDEEVLNFKPKNEKPTDYIAELEKFLEGLDEEDRTNSSS